MMSESSNLDSGVMLIPITMQYGNYKGVQLVLLIILLLNLIKRTNASITSSESNEDEILRQALFLVKLLKSEYAKVLRENIELQKGSDSEELDNSTCPTTLEDPRLNISSTLQVTSYTNTLNVDLVETTTAKTPSPRVSSSSTTSKSTLRRLKVSTEANSFKPPFRHMRRRMFSPHYKYGNVRRDYDDPFGEHPEETERSTIVTTVATTELGGNDRGAETISKETTSTSTSTPKSFQQLTAPVQLLKLSAKVTNLPQGSGQNPTGLRPKPLNGTGEGGGGRPTLLSVMKKKTSEDPNVLSEVASELINELNDDNIENVKLGKIHKWIDKTDTPTYLKSTMKVYLKGSSRFPVPLPENHAFCHTNPYNPLCRTFIG